MTDNNKKNKKFHPDDLGGLTGAKYAEKLGEFKEEVKDSVKTFLF